MTLHVGPLPAGDERHLKALARVRPVVIGRWVREVSDEQLVEAVVAAYFAQLRKEGVRLVDASEVAEWLRAGGSNPTTPWVVADGFLARFGGGDEG